MELDLDAAYAIAEGIIRDALAHEEQISTEEDAKINLITRMLVEALGWHTSDIGAERKHDAGYSDYILHDEGMAAFLVEAKRLGAVEVSSSDRANVRRLKLSGPALLRCQEGIDQAASYAAPNGIQIAVLTDGKAWIVFKSFTPGSSYKEKKAFVFPDFNAVLSDFSLFFDLLSKAQFRKKVYRAAFDEIHENRGVLAHPLAFPIREGEIRLVPKNALAFDLDRVFSAFFSRLTGDEDEEMLIDCFVESQESRIADFALEKITASVLGNLTPDRDVDEQLATLIERTVDIDTGETVFLVGPTGSGKSTFLSRFFKRTLSDRIRQRCVVSRINCLDSSGQPELAAGWLTDQVINAIESQLYAEGFPGWDELQGLYHLEYIKRAKGSDKYLYDRSKDEFKEKFGRYVEELTLKDREGYLKKLLLDIVRNRKMLPIIVVDNTDEFSLDYRSVLFQAAQAMRRHAEHCLLIFPVTDKSAWSFSKTDIYSIYQSRSFFLPTPPPREIFRKRIEFLRRRINEAEESGASGSYFSKKGISVSIENLGKFTGVIEDIFVDHDYAAKALGELANYNIRRTLALSRRVITSSVFDVDSVVKSYITGAPIASSFSKFMNALLKGDYEAYRQSDGHEVFPIFQVESAISQSPLMSLRILALLYSVRISNREVDQQHLSVQSIFDYFDAIGATEAAVDTSLLWLLEARLLEPYDSSIRELSPAQRVAISHSGLAHLRLASSNEVFVEQMAFTTGIRNDDVAQQIREIYRAKGDFTGRMAQARKVFISELLREDSHHLADPRDLDQYSNQRSLIERLCSVGGLTTEGEAVDPTGTGEGSLERFPVRVRAVVDWYNADRGYAFLSAEGFDDRIYMNEDVLSATDRSELMEGDVIICDLVRNDRGLIVTEVHEVESSDDVSSDLDCRVIRYWPDRKYGFARVLNGHQDVFFPLSIFSEEQQSQIGLGSAFRARVVPDAEGRLRATRLIA